MPLDNPAFAGYRPSSQESSGLLDMLFGPIKYLGDTLSKPAAALRGLLAGQPGQLANLIPFSDALGITDPNQRVSGRDMLRSWGLVGNENNAGNFLGGMLAEFATDPLLAASMIPGSMAKMTGLIGKATGTGASPTVGQALGAVGEQASALGSKAASYVPQGIKAIPGKLGNATDDLIERLGGSRVFTGTPGTLPPSSVATRGMFGSTMTPSPLGTPIRHHKELTDWLPMLEGTAKAEVTDDIAQLASRIENLSQGRLPFGMNPPPSTPGLLRKGLDYAGDTLSNLPGLGYAQSAMNKIGGLSAGAMAPGLSLGSSLSDMADEQQPGPSPQEMQMLLQMMQTKRRRKNPLELN